MVNLQEIVEPHLVRTVRGKFYEGINGREFSLPKRKTAHIEDGKIVGFDDSPQADIDIPESILIIPGGVDTHVHVRDPYDILPGQKGSQSHKEDAFTLSLALAHGGATHGACMFNFSSMVSTNAEYKKEIVWMNSDLPHRKRPIMRLSGHTVVQPEEAPQSSGNMWDKLFWATIEGTFKRDDQVPATLQHYYQRRVKAHCETIADIIDDPALPHHVRRPKQAALNAVRMFLECAEKYNFTADVAHVSSADELDIIQDFKRRGVRAYAELTPQQITLDNENFEEQTGRPLKWGQQNPPLRSAKERLELRTRAWQADYFGTDHAPHTKEEKERGISGMPQADTASQVYLELVSEGVLTLRRFIEMRSIVPGQILEERFGLKMGQLRPGYDASFALVSLGKPSRVTDADVLSKCGWTPYQEMTFKNTVEGVMIGGVLYTEAALKKLKPNN